MKLLIETKNNNIVVLKDFSKPDNLGEIAQYITELEILKRDLMNIYKNFKYKK